MSERKCNKKEDFNLSYVGLRDDVFNLVPDNINKVLNMGCSIGALGEHIKRKNNNVEVVGVETDKQMAKVAKEKIDRVIMEDIERINLIDYFQHNYFDCIVFAIESLKDHICLTDSLSILFFYPFKEFVIFQYLMVSKKKKSDSL